MSVSNKKVEATSKSYRFIGNYHHTNGVVRATYVIIGKITNVSKEKNLYTATIEMGNGKVITASTFIKANVDSYVRNMDQLIVIQKDNQYGNMICEPWAATSPMLKAG